MSNSDFTDGSGSAGKPTSPNPAPPAVPAAPDGRGPVLARPSPDGEDGAARSVTRKLAPASPAASIRPLAPTGTALTTPPDAAPPAKPAPLPAVSPAPVPPAPRPPAPSPSGAQLRPASTSAPEPSGGPGATTPIEAFLAPGQEHRLRDLLAFGMAAEAGKPGTPDAVDTMRRQADAALEAYAFRSLHNRVEEIRRAAIDEQLGKLRQTPGFQGIVVANLVAMIAAAMIALLLWWLHAVFSMGS